MGKTHYKWPFSIAMLNYQRVSFPWSLVKSWFWWEEPWCSLERHMFFMRRHPHKKKLNKKTKHVFSGNNRNKLNGFCWCFSKFSRKPTESLETARRAWWVNSFMKRAAGLCGGAILSWRRLGKATGSWDLKKSQMGAMTCNHKTRLGTRRCPHFGDFEHHFISYSLEISSIDVYPLFSWVMFN